MLVQAHKMLKRILTMDVDGCQSVLRQVEQKLSERRNRNLHQAIRQQRLAAAAGGETKFTRNGFVKARIHPEFYHYWGQRLGYECWEDPGFMREFLRDNPEARVKARPPKATILVSDLPAKRRFHKVYEDGHL